MHFTQNFMLIPNLQFFPGLLQYFGRYRQSKFGQNPKNAVFWARFAMVTVFFGPNRLILTKATQGRYWAAMLGSVEVGASMFWSVPLVPARCRYRAGTVPAPSPGRSVLLRAGTGPVILCIYRWCRLVPIGAGRCRFRGEIAGTAVFIKFL